jgi:hypothetical protein
MDSGTQISLLPSYESSVYNDYLINTLRLTSTDFTNSGSNGDNLKTASISLDVASLIPPADVKIAPDTATIGIKKAADMVTKTKNQSEIFAETIDTVNRCRKFLQIKKVLAIWVMLLVAAMFVLYTFVLSPLPVSFGDNILPSLLGVSLLWGLFETLILKTV